MQAYWNSLRSVLLRCAPCISL